MATEIPTEALEAAARALFAHDRLPDDEPWETLGHNDHDSYRKAALVCLTAAAPFLIAEGRRQAAADIRAVDVQRIADLEGDTARVGLTVASRIAEGGGDRANPE